MMEERDKCRSKYIKICDILSSDIVEEGSFHIYGVSDSEDPISNTLIFVKNGLNTEKHIKESIIVTKQLYEVDDSNILVITDTPKNEYGKFLSRVVALLPNKDKRNVNGSFVSTDAVIGEGTSIGSFCTIEEDVIIGKNCEIADYVYIGAHTRIADNVIVKQRSIIGAPDADVYREDERCLTLPHLGGVIIEKGVLILSGAQILAGDTRATVIGKGSMVGPGAIVGHNNVVGENSMISGFSCVCGHCNIENNVYIAPGATVINRSNLGKGSKVGLGAIAMRNVEENTTVLGNPARIVWKKR